MSTILEIQTMWSLFIVLVVQMITVKFFEATNTISPHKAQVLVQLSVFQIIISWILFTSTVLYLKSKTKLSWLSNSHILQAGDMPVNFTQESTDLSLIATSPTWNEYSHFSGKCLLSLWFSGGLKLSRLSWCWFESRLLNTELENACA